MGLFEQVLADMRGRAAVARASAKNNPDGTVHHEAVADMLEHLAARAEEAHKREIDAKDAEIARWRDQALQEDAAAEAMRSENARLRVIVSGATVAEGNLREEIERLREIVKELADELETMICNEIVKSSKRRVK